MDAIGEALGSAFQTVAGTIYWIAARIFGLTTTETTPGWAKLAAALLILGTVALLTWLLWAWIIAAVIVLAIAGLALGFLANL
jgi:hypothetical protein